VREHKQTFWGSLCLCLLTFPHRQNVQDATVTERNTEHWNFMNNSSSQRNTSFSLFSDFI
jgi:hypothetical protein